MPDFLRKRSPDGATPNCDSTRSIAAYYSFIDPEGLKGCVCLVTATASAGTHIFLSLSGFPRKSR